MCGITGALWNTPQKALDGATLKRMVESLRHRGPDDEGDWRSEFRLLEANEVRPGVALGFRRLSIIDLEGGAQPMKDGHGNVLTYNGEIYNYLELRQELGQENFRTSCDTEVILVGYRRWGEAVVDKLRGMFSFALWDEANQRLFCARDRFGIKPFYYAEQEGVFTFASEPKALLPFLPEVATDHEGLMDYLVVQFCLAGKTLFRHVRELEAVRDLANIELLVDMLPERVGSPLSVNSLCRDLEVSHRAVSNWLEILSRLYFSFRLPPYTHRAIRGLKKEQKTYLWDWSLVSDPGPRLENMLASHLLKLCHHLEDVEGRAAKLHYLRDRNGRELDFLVTVDKKPWFAVEAKTTETAIGSPLRYFRDRLHIPHVYQCVLHGTRTYVQDGVTVVPAYRFLEAVA